MEFQEAITRLALQTKPLEKQRWKIITFRRSTSSSINAYSKPQKKSTSTSIKPQDAPREFLCPISGALMNDPVIVSSGHTFERACVQACNTLGFTPTLEDGAGSPDFSTVIPNLALKSAILNWCKKHSLNPPKPLDFFTAERLVRSKLEKTQQVNRVSYHEDRAAEKDLINRVKENPPAKLNFAVSDLTPGTAHHFSTSSDESLTLAMPTPPLQLATRPSCYSSASSSSEIEALLVNPEEEEFLTKLKSALVHEVEEGLVSLRRITRTKEDTRAQLCTPRLLSTLQSLILSRYTSVQVNSVACIVNLSLEKANKVKIVRSGTVPLLIDVLKGGFSEAREHACGAIFSLALDDHNKTAIGVLGALPPLLHLLRAESERTRHDSALALYHLSLVQINKSKLVRLGSVPLLLGLVKSGQMPGRVLLVLSNLASCEEGRAALLDSGAVECLVGLLRGDELQCVSTRDSCVSVLYGLSHGGLRFRGLAKATGVVEVLLEVENSGSERSKEKAKRMLEMMKERIDAEEDVDWEELLESGSMGTTRSSLGCKKVESGANSSEF
ncbi:hypothetical protein Tsubulata_013620 [Turnera subulata]|uniref:RING-type E3 ubiquitin transferase n=1 Tax=Turnera subulata TaxID=218843 RepID=A0A9Q0F8Z8_9ROSI|nr:hypothetical protein Tsubulata_013620 [Turnera subulata]